MAVTSRATAEPAVGSSRWEQGAGGWTLWLEGDWRAAAAPLAALPAQVQGTVSFDTAQLTGWDSALPAALYQQLAPLRRRGVALVLDSLPAGVRAVLDLALPEDAAAAPAAPAALPHLGWWADALLTITFFGEVVHALVRLLRGRSGMRGVDLWRQVDQTGPLSVPIVSLTCFLVGLLLAYMGGAQLDRIGAQTLIADVVTVGMVREMAGLMTGVILSGRLGASFAAQIGTMKANEEIDALRVLGVNPIDYLVLPRLLALVLIAPLLIAWAALVGVLAGLPAAVAVYDVPATDYLHNCVEALTWTHLWIGLFKGTLYAALVALAGCREGLHAGRNAQAVGEATTAAVVKALIWIVFAACGTTIVFQSLGL
jgi:phospholipid/cholesterol/gamma-HCH transport system permease protein